VTGQTFYLPVRRQYEDAEIAKIDALLKTEREKLAGDKDWERKELFKHGLALEEIDRRGRYSRSGDGEGKDPVLSEFGKELSGAGQEIDDLRSGIGSDTSLAGSYDRAGNIEQRDALQASALARQQALQRLEQKRAALRQGGVEGFRDSRTRSIAGETAKAISDRLGPDLARILNDPQIPAAVKADAQRDFQAEIDRAIGGATKRYKSGLGRSM
jgi:hypothetical protein